MRLFFAFDLPPDQARRLSALAPPGISGIRPVDPERMHVTLRFVGDVPSETRDRLADGLRRLGPLPTAEDRTVRVDGVGVFPGPRRARVLWAGLRIRESLVALQRSIESSCVAAGLPDEGSAWHPHVTLARFTAGPPPGLDDWLDRYADLRLDPFVVDAITLYDSRTTESGPAYLPVASIGP